MLGAAVVIVIAVAAALVIFAVGTFGVVLYVRHKHRLIVERHGLNLDAPRYVERTTAMSGGEYEGNGQHESTPRRSVALPYGMAANGWNTLPAGDAASPANSVAMFHPQVSPIVDHPHEPKRKKSLRKSFSAHSFSIPKTRRQKKIEKTIPLNRIPRSPLSAITERSGTNTEAPSPALGLTELPTDVTPNDTPDKENIIHHEQRSSIAWPLPVAKRTSHEAANSASRPVFGPRSISLSSQMSAAPDEPLPPLPTFSTENRGPQRQKSTSQYSSMSSETVGTSVLGTATTPNVRVPTTRTISPHPPSSPSINIHQTGLQAYDPSSQRYEPSILSLGTPPGKKTMHSTRRANAGLGSTHGSIKTSSMLKNALGGSGTEEDTRTQSRAAGPNLETIDASQWDPSPTRRTSRRNSKRLSGVRSPSQRHSMFETLSDFGGASPVSAMESPSVSKPQRPLSVGAATALSDGRSVSARSSMSSITSTGSQKKGHKRQNCVRIANLPPTDVTRRHSKLRLPLMTEEEEQQENEAKPTQASPTSSAEKLVKIPGLELVNQEQEERNKSNPLRSLFDNAPVLEPTSRGRPLLLRADTDDSESSDIPSDSDVFGGGSHRHQYDKPHITNVFARHYGRGQDSENQLQSATEKRLQQNNPRNLPAPSTTPPRTGNEPYDPASPMLPTPTISSANLFTRKFQSRYAKKSAGGPNGPRAQALGPDPHDSSTTARDSSPTPTRPLNVVKGSADAATKDPSGQDLRRSAMMLRRMNSEMREQRGLGTSYRSYRNISDMEEETQSAARADPSTNENIARRDGRQDARGTDASGLSSIRMQMKSPSTADMLSYSSAEARRDTFLRPDPMPAPLNTSRNKQNVGVSPSIMSMGAQSDIWEDASVKSETDEPAPALPNQRPHREKENVVEDSGFESFAGACEIMQPQPHSGRKAQLQSQSQIRTRTPTRQAAPRQPAVMDSGFESFAGVCEVIDTSAPTRKPPPKQSVVIDSGFESFAGVCDVIDTQPTSQHPGLRTPVHNKRQGGYLQNPESTKKSPGYGLGLMGIGLSAWGTPASLYDKDGFLKD